MNNIVRNLKDGHALPVENLSAVGSGLGHLAVGTLNKPSFAANVVEFNQRVLKINQRPVGMLVQAELDISKKSLVEEITEFSEAAQHGDLIGMIDALVDLQYFAVGVMYKMGLTASSIDACMLAVHDANMEKKLGVNARRGDGSAADAVKPADWVGPEERISKIVDRQMAGLAA